MNIIITEREEKPEVEVEQAQKAVEMPDVRLTEDERRAVADAKSLAKNESKKAVGKKFRIGDEYWIKIANVKKTYKLVKFVYTIGPNDVSSLVMLQTGGPVTNTYTLNEHDCRRLHIKYRDGLQVFSMKLKWNRIKK